MNFEDKIIYFDVNETALEKKTTNTINKTLNKKVELANFSNISLVKADLSFDLPILKVLLKQNLDKEYETKFETEGYPTNYSFIITYFDKEQNKFIDKEYTINFINKSSNVKPSYNYKNDKIVVDNFNDYFLIKNLEYLNECINETIYKAFKENISDNEELKNIIPSIYSSNDTLSFNILTCYSDSYNFYQSREELIKSNNQKGFSYGFNYDLYNMYFRTFKTELYTFNDNEYYFITENFHGTAKKLTVNHVDYYLQNFEDNEYYTRCNEYKSILITCNTIPTSLTYIRLKKQFEYDIKQQSDNALNQSDERILAKINISHDKEHINRIIYVNSNIKNNTRSITENAEFTNIEFNLYLVDKYGFYYPLYLNKYDNVEFEFCIF